MKLISDICYGKLKHPEQYLDIYLPDTDSFKVVVYMHGGYIYPTNYTIIFFNY